MNDRELAGRIFKDLKTVQKKWFDLMMLCFVDGLTYTEAAQILHTSEPVLRARMRRARAYVKKTFGAEYRQRNKT
jgi:DNA-directed RNA polymerase specialized sigma24 family protein